jgi:hypothetical protein
VPVTRYFLYREAPGVQWRLAHTHLNLAGFVIMIIFGIAYHILTIMSHSRNPAPAWNAPHVRKFHGCALPLFLAGKYFVD